MNLAEITPVVLTRDEEANLARTLSYLSWADEVLVVDSHSTDRTPEIARGFPNVRFLTRELDTLAGQSSFGLQQARTPWVLLFDADYVMPPEMVDELRELDPSPLVRGYVSAFVYAVGGRPLRASLYPARVVLLAREHASVWQDGHAHRVLVDGEIDRLRSRIIHDDRKPFSRFLQRQKRYMKQEAEKLRNADPRSLSLPGHLRRLVVVAPIAVLFHTLFVKGLVLDGRPGLLYAFERFVAELILSAELLRSGWPWRRR